MDTDLGRVPAEPGSREPRQSALSRPSGFDPSRASAVLLELVGNGYLTRGSRAIILDYVARLEQAVQELGDGRPDRDHLSAATEILEEFVRRDSDGSPEGRDRETGLDGAAATARAAEIAKP